MVAYKYVSVLVIDADISKLMVFTEFYCIAAYLMVNTEKEKQCLKP